MPVFDSMGVARMVPDSSMMRHRPPTVMSHPRPINEALGKSPLANKGACLPEKGVLNDLLADLVPPLPQAPRTRLLLVSCGVKIHFPWQQACDIHQQAISSARQAVGDLPIDIIETPEPYEDPDLLVAELGRQLGKGVDGIIFIHAAYTAGEIGAHLGRWLYDHPVPFLSWSWPDPTGGNLTANSLCCQNFLLNIFTRLGVRYAWGHGPFDETMRAEVLRFARSARARARYQHARVLHVGGSRVTAFYDGETDELAVMRRFGLRFDRLDLQAEADHGKKFKESDVRRLFQALKDSPSCRRVDVPEEQALRTLRFGLAILDLAAERGYVGCTVKSWPELFECYGCAIDGAVSMLNDCGFCTAEEGEMNGLISSLSLHFLSEGTAVTSMMDLSSVNAAANRLGIWHCGASPTRMLKAGTQYDLRRHSILENSDPATAVGMMIEFLLELGPITVTRYQSPDATRCFTFEGDLVEAPLAFRGAYGEMVPRDGSSVSSIINTILSHGLDHHWSLGYGHWHSEQKLLNHWLGVSEVPLGAAGSVSGLSIHPPV